MCSNILNSAVAPLESLWKHGSKIKTTVVRQTFLWCEAIMHVIFVSSIQFTTESMLKLNTWEKCFNDFLFSPTIFFHVTLTHVLEERPSGHLLGCLAAPYHVDQLKSDLILDTSRNCHWVCILQGYALKIEKFWTSRFFPLLVGQSRAQTWCSRCREDKEVTEQKNA